MPDEPDGKAAAGDYVARGFYQNTSQARHYASERFSGSRGATHRRGLAALEKALSGLEGIRTVLDIPAGTGRISRPLEAGGASVTASDVSLEMLLEASARQSAHYYVQADATALPFGDAAFDAVVSMRFIYHLPSRRQRVKALSEMARVSRKWIAVSFFDAGTAQGIRSRLSKRLAHCPETRRLLTLDQIKSEAAEAGLGAVRVVPTLQGISEHTIILFEKADEARKALWRRRRGVVNRLAGASVPAQRYWDRLGLCSFAFIAALALLLAFIPWLEIENELVIWGGGGGLIFAALFLRRRILLGVSSNRSFDRETAESAFHSNVRLYTLSWVLVASGVVVMSELAWLLPFVWAFYFAWRKAFSGAAEREMLFRLRRAVFETAANVATGRSLLNFVKADSAVLASVAFSCTMLVAKEVLFESLFGW
ncbi:MAG: class I SAM-dependent methyltransferase [Planctomycetes bacterium]|nr:class I SAM-dependent methyltransferase [Planctomycetota bacterium]